MLLRAFVGPLAPQNSTGCWFERLAATAVLFAVMHSKTIDTRGHHDLQNAPAGKPVSDILTATLAESEKRNRAAT